MKTLSKILGIFLLILGLGMIPTAISMLIINFVIGIIILIVVIITVWLSIQLFKEANQKHPGSFTKPGSINKR